MLILINVCIHYNYPNDGQVQTRGYEICCYLDSGPTLC